MTRLFDFAVLARGRLGNAIIQKAFDSCEALFVPSRAVVDETDSAGSLSALIPGNDGRQVSVWRWIKKTGFIVHRPPWLDRMRDVLSQVTTRDLLVQMVRDPRAHAAALFTHTVRHRIADTLINNAPVADKDNWLNRVGDIDLVLAELTPHLRFYAVSQEFSALFRRHIWFDFAGLAPDRIDRFIARLFEEIGTPFTGDIAPLREIEHSVARLYMLYSRRKIDVCGLPIEVVINYAGAQDPFASDYFDYELARVDHAEVLSGRSLAFDLAPKPLILQTNASEYFALPSALRRMTEREGVMQQFLRETLPIWLTKSDTAERTTQMVLKRTDMARVVHRGLEIAAPDVEALLRSHPELCATWNL